MDESQAFLEEVFRQLAQFRKFPKYQLERRVDAFIGVFLPRILKSSLGWETEVVAPEFPIKKTGSNQSTNIDYLLYRRSNPSAKEGWVFFELKTDAGSLSEKQLAIYRHAQKIGMTRLKTQLGVILNRTREKEKYRHLKNALERFRLDRPIELLYLLPSRARLPEDIPRLTLKEIAKHSVEDYSGCWRTFCSEVLAEIDPE